MATQLNWVPLEQAPVVTPAPAPVSQVRFYALHQSVTGAADAGNSSRQAPTLDQSLQAVARQLDSYLKSIGRTLNFSVDEATHRTVITVRDSAGTVIRQIPSEEALRLAQTLGAGPNALIDLTV